MPTIPNKTIAQCKCRMGDHIADVRRMKNHERGALYLVCPECGVDRTSGKFQKVLDDHIQKFTLTPEPEPEAIPAGPEDDPEPEPQAEPAAIPAGPKEAPKPEPKKPGFFAVALYQFAEWME